MFSWRPLVSCIICSLGKNFSLHRYIKLFPFVKSFWSLYTFGIGGASIGSRFTGAIWIGMIGFVVIMTVSFFCISNCFFCLGMPILLKIKKTSRIRRLFVSKAAQWTEKNRIWYRLFVLRSIAQFLYTNLLELFCQFISWTNCDQIEFLRNP